MLTVTMHQFLLLGLSGSWVKREMLTCLSLPDEETRK